MATQIFPIEPDSEIQFNQTYGTIGNGTIFFPFTPVPDDVLFAHSAIDPVGDRDYFRIPTFNQFFPPHPSLITVHLVGAPSFDGTLSLLRDSTVVATGTSLGNGETYLQYRYPNDSDGAESLMLVVGENGDDQTGAYTLFIDHGDFRTSPIYTPTGGNDTVIGASVHNLLVGGSGNDSLSGGVGPDVLIGGLGVDSLQGGLGDDTYVLNSGFLNSDFIVEQAGQGTDAIWTNETFFELSSLPNVENLSSLRTFSGGFFSGTGNALDNVITGAPSGDFLHGMSGNDVLDGRGGDDDMYGESGNDTFRVDQAGDRVIETVGDGTDLVLSSLVSYTLPNNVENLTLVEGSGAIQGVGNALANVIYGTSGHNGLVGNGGDDVLIGLGGPDAMFGGTGNDTYYVDDEGDGRRGH
jgi:Ca2+-binding RTX toxin-like protein